MKHFKLTIMLVVLMSMAAGKAFAYDAKIDGIYYNFSGTEATVTCYSSSDYDNRYAYVGAVVIPEVVTYNGTNYSVTEIASSAFSGCSGLTSVTIPNSVTCIGNYAFDGCSGLTSVAIPNSVTTIGKSAFSGCSGLTSVTIPNSVRSIGWFAFSGCSGLSKVIVKDITAWCGISFVDSSSNPLYYANHLYSDESTEITNLVIPESVTAINYAFSGCSGLTSVTIPNSVTTIGDDAFYDCSGLTSVTIPNSVTTIGDGAFDGCSSLTSVTIPNSVTTIGYSAFMNCSSLTSVTIPDGVTTIDYVTFYGCSGLSSVTIPNSVTKIGERAFQNCSGLTSVKIPNSVTTIDRSAFYGCSGLTSVTIPNSVTTIGGYAFGNCSSLTSVTIGSGVTSIEYYAFNSNLTTVISLIEKPFIIDYNVFSTYTFVNADLYVPQGTMSKYKATYAWKNFLWIQEGIPTGVDNVKTDGSVTEKSRYTMDGKQLEAPEKGINIIKMNDGTTKKVMVK